MSESQSILLISIFAFLAIAILVYALYMVFQGGVLEGESKVQRRLRSLSAGGGHGKEVLDTLLARKQLSSVPFINRILLRIPRAHALDRSLEQAGLDLSVMRYLGIQIVLVAVFVGLLLWLGRLPTAVSVALGILAGIVVPNLYVARRQRQRKQRFTQQLPETLDFIARSLRAGNPFTVSLKAVANELPDPIGTEFGITFDEINYGLELEDALSNLSERTGSEEIQYFITAVLIQKTSGGNLADLLNRIAEVMRARATTQGEIRIQAAEMRLSAQILIALPFLLAGVISIVNPEYLPSLIGHRIGRAIIVLQIILMAMGYLIIRRMVNFRI